MATSLQSHYDFSGSISLSREPYRYPEPGLGEQEALEALAEKLGYTLKRSILRPALRAEAEDLLQEFDFLSTVLFFEGSPDDSPRGRQDFEELLIDGFGFSLANIRQLFVELPGFFAELEARAGIYPAVDIRFDDWSRKSPSVLMSWAQGKLLWTEETPVQLPVF
jgi:hypothetical protein